MISNTDPLTIYLTEPGLTVKRRSAHFVIREQDGMTHKVPLVKLGRMIVMRGVGVSMDAIATMLDCEIPLTFLDRNGSLLGHISPAHRHDAKVRLDQYELYRDKAVRVGIARELVRAKIHNMIRVVSRFKHNHPALLLGDRIASMNRALGALPSANTVEEAMGYEGIASKHYFAAFALMVPEEMNFSGRNRRPPRDPVNALLSFGYTLMTREMAGIIEAEGLDPYVGFLHALKPGRPSLALDLIEPLRSCIIDRLILLLMNKKILGRDDFRNDTGSDGAVLLSDTGRKQFFAEYEKWMLDGADRDLCDELWFGRQALCDEAVNFKKATQGGVREWRPHYFK